MNSTETDISEEEIARRAYEIWQSRGCPPGDGREDWEAALAELTAIRRERQNGSSGIKVWWTRVRRKLAG